MDDLKAAIKRIASEQQGNKKLLVLLFALVIAITFIVSTATSGSARTVGSKNHAASSPQATISLPSFYVHVVGEVKNPGVYQLEVGSRLFDAVVAAGGFLQDAEQASVNLARPLTDGEQIIVLKQGQMDSGPSSGGGAGLVSINRGTEAELESLPGVGPALAGRIIDWRAANGGFKKKEDLLNVGGIGDKLFAGLSKLITL